MKRAQWAAAVAAMAMAGTGPGVASHHDSFITAKVAVRETVSGVTSVTIESTGQSITDLLASLPNNRQLTLGHAPEGWKLNQNGRLVRLNGPTTDDLAVRLDARGGSPRDYLGRDVTLQVGLNGTLGAPQRLLIEGLPRARTSTLVDGILTYPPEGTPQSAMLVGVASDYRGGRWELTGGNGTTFPVPLISPDSIREISVLSSTYGPEFGNSAGGVIQMLTRRPSPQPFVSVFPASGRITGAKYWDRFGELVVDAPISIAPAPARSCDRSLTSGSQYTFTGQAACISGCFPTVESAYGLLLDGRTELMPWGVSPTTVMLGIPDDTTPGPHTVSAPGGTSSVTIGVLKLEGSLDKNVLQRLGQPTTMRMRVSGTDQPIAIRVVNQSPGIITITGPNPQVVMTSGGPANQKDLTVQGIEKGNFTIVYSVNSPGCGKPPAPVAAGVVR